MFASYVMCKGVVYVCLAWQQVVKLAAVDCADMKNEPVCKEHAVTVYPTLYVSNIVLC